MDLNAYYNDMKAEEAALRRDFPNNVVHVTSLFHRDRNSTAGNTVSASCRNAARVITDGTHRRATDDEVKNFLNHQQDELRKNTVSEQMNKKQYFVVLPNGGEQPTIANAAGVGPNDGSVVAALATSGRATKGREA